MNAQPKQEIQTETQLEAKAELLEQVIKKTEDIIVTDRGLDFGTFTGLWRLANMIHRSHLAPNGIDTVEGICIVIAKGRSLGLDPFQSLESIAVINNRPLLWGQAALAVCRRSPKWDESAFKEWFEVAGKPIIGNPTIYTDDTTAVCRVKRSDAKEAHEIRFSVTDAKIAKLWQKTGRDNTGTPWTFYPQRMLKFRARGFALWDHFNDVLKGLGIREVADDRAQTIDSDKELLELNRRIPSEPERVPLTKTAKETHDGPPASLDEGRLEITDADLPENMREAKEQPKVEEHPKPKGVPELRLEIFDLLASTGRDEIAMNILLKDVSMYEGKWMDLKNLMKCPDLLWLVHTLGKLKKELSRSNAST